MEYLLAAIIGVASSFTASLLFLYLLRRFRPKLSISPQIARYKPSSGPTEYIIKVVNRKKRPIINIRVRLLIITRMNVPGGYVNNTKKVELKTEDIFQISGFDPNATTVVYTWRFLTHQNLEQLWSSDESV